MNVDARTKKKNMYAVKTKPISNTTCSKTECTAALHQCKIHMKCQHSI